MIDFVAVGSLGLIVATWLVMLWLILREPGHDTQKGNDMTKQEIRDAIEFLQRVFVGPGDVDRLEAAIAALQAELKRRNKK